MWNRHVAKGFTIQSFFTIEMHLEVKIEIQFCTKKMLKQFLLKLLLA